MLSRKHYLTFLDTKAGLNLQVDGKFAKNRKERVCGTQEAPDLQPLVIKYRMVNFGDPKEYFMISLHKNSVNHKGTIYHF